ncbi:heavy-metal-associated domain-containing protein [Enterovirga aerilata]|uniref:Heavy-metal-associated domain-containing protein n=1 Tax=Enterovirga aerilata TaxID=2730920 RepID=A0A849I9A2_9HYPH|nr:heavy-metal-associated domain-containing protein [Enterovirga sp. DB1703]NNM73891.1 heavy-metal-associated domain-containing protein [Enterovirga sp. DB1703]
MLHLEIANMSCGGCAHGVTNTIRAVAPQAAVEIQLAERKVTVRGAPDEAKVVEALKSTGFETSVSEALAE